MGLLDGVKTLVIPFRSLRASMHGFYLSFTVEVPTILCYCLATCP